MLSGESTPLLKESIALRPAQDTLDIAANDRNSVLFGGTKVLQATAAPQAGSLPLPPDSGCLALVLKTGFGSSQGQLIRTMIFSTERVSANNLESFLFIAFLLVFAIAASAYVWVKGVENDRKRTKLLLDCVIIITSVVPPELPMELSLAVNGSLVALSKLAIFCTEPFRIPFAGRVDICCFDKTGTLTGEDLEVEGIAGLECVPLTICEIQQLTCCISMADMQRLQSPKDAPMTTRLTLAAAHALVLLDGGVVGDPMEKTTLSSLGWQLGNGDILTPVPAETENSADGGVKSKKSTAVVSSSKLTSGLHVAVKRRFQFSSALKRMSTVSTSFVPEDGSRRLLGAVKGAPETLKPMFVSVPNDYEATYRYFAQRGSRVLALGYKYIEVNNDKVRACLNFRRDRLTHCIPVCVSRSTRSLERKSKLVCNLQASWSFIAL